MNSANVCACHHHKLVPLMIVLIGVLFLLQAFGIVTPMLVAICWPVLLIIAGLTKLAGRTCSCCGETK